MIVRPTFSYTNYGRLQEFLYYMRKFHLLAICVCAILD